VVSKTAKSLIDSYNETFAPACGLRLFRAPGRVNLIGEHTDYNLGFVLPIALDLACYAATGPNGEGKLRLFSGNLEQWAEWPVEAIRDLEPSGEWTDYVVGVAQQLLASGYEITPLNVLIQSTVPTGSGLSSSASLEVAAALALLQGRPIEPLELAKVCHRAETQFAGLPCGIMDQFISIFGRDLAAIKIDCRSLEHEPVELPAQLEVIAVNSMVKHELGQSAYRDRVRECAEAVEAARRFNPKVRSLRDFDGGLWHTMEPALPRIPRKRARHILTENVRVQQFAEASRAGDPGRMGKLFLASHESMREDYEITCEEIDFLVESAMAQEGVHGARMTGGGFGGCTVNLVAPYAAGSFRAAMETAYQDRYGTCLSAQPHSSIGSRDPSSASSESLLLDPASIGLLPAGLMSLNNRRSTW
jgi:galactokinase